MYVPLVKDTISHEEIDNLSNWLKSHPKLTQGDLVAEFEDKFSKWQGRKYSVFVNSGSSANLLAAYTMKLGKLKNNKVVIPALSWSTTLAPWIQFGFEVHLCDADKESLGVDTNHLEEIFKTQSPSVLMLVNVLGFPNNFNEINYLCHKYNVVLLEDSCETMGSEYNGIKCGNFGLMSTFSTYFAHHFSSIEGGIICTDDFNIYNTLKMLREHGWARRLDKGSSDKLKETYKVDDFNESFTFYVPGFNVRSTEINAFLALSQLERLDSFCAARQEHFLIYRDNIKATWFPNPPGNRISNFAYPIITPKRNELVEHLKKNQIECRPMIAGSLADHPVWTEYGSGPQNLPFASEIHRNGLYLPNNHLMTREEIFYVCEKVNEVLA